MKYQTIFILFLCVFSCDYFDKKKVTSQEILKEDLQTFNWNEVDEYPTFESCDSSATKAQRKQCFETTLTTHITQELLQEKIVVTKDVNDTITINFLISEKGTLSVLEVNRSEPITLQIPQIDNLLIQSLKDLPQILPAFKRGQPVKTEFKIPVVIKVD
jgi:hypothetical protein